MSSPSLVRAFLLALCFLVSSCGAVYRSQILPPPLAAPPYHPPIDWSAAGQEAAQVLSAYLQVDTTNPPGNEEKGAEFLRDLLAREGIESRILSYAPGRGSLIARLPGHGPDKPLCLMSHMDVVTAEADKWAPGKAPLGGLIEEGQVWGRGALDMKGMGTIEAMTLIWLKRLGIPLKRDVILLAVADEEVNNQGIRHLVDEHWGEIGCSELINEGGLGLKGAFFPDQTVYAISVAEKGALWVKMVALGEPGHGSTPRPGGAPWRLMDAVDKLREREVKARFHPSFFELLYQVGKSQKGLSRAVLTHPSSVRSLLTPRLMKNPVIRATLTNTVNLTGFSGAREPNVIPSEVSAILDCRLLPGVQPQEVLEELKALTGHDPHLRFEIIDQKSGNDSPWNTPLYEALARRAVEGRADAVAGPVVSPGFTDSIIVREKGVHAYGLVPFEVTAEELATMHGNNERVSIANLESGLRILLNAVMDVAGR